MRDKSFMNVYQLFMAYHRMKALSGSAKNVRISQESVGGGIHSNSAEDQHIFVADVEIFLRIIPPYQVKILLCRYCPDEAQKSFGTLANYFADTKEIAAPFRLRYKGRVHDELKRAESDARFYFMGKGYIRREV